jgi:hypothetical protein
MSVLRQRQQTESIDVVEGEKRCGDGETLSITKKDVVGVETGGGG